MSQCPPEFSYVEVGKAVDFDSLEMRGENLGKDSQENLGKDSQEILEDLDFGIEALDLKSLGFGSSGLGYLANGFGLPHSSN